MHPALIAALEQIFKTLGKMDIYNIYIFDII